MATKATASAHNGQSDDTNSPDEWTSTVVGRMIPASLSIGVVCAVTIVKSGKAL